MKPFFKKVRTTADLLDKPWMWLTFSGAILLIDYYKGPFIQFPIAFILPVALSAWQRGLRWALAFAILLPLVRLSYSFIWPVPWTTLEAVTTFFIRVVVLASFALLVNRTARQTRSWRKN